MLIAFTIVGGVMVLVGVGLTLQVDNWARDLTTNRASTRDDATDELLRPIETSQPPDKVVQATKAAVNRLSNWSGSETLVENDRTVIRLVRTSRMLQLKDDITLQIEATADGSVITATSQSRVGGADLGRNPRNLKELFGQIRKELNRQE